MIETCFSDDVDDEEHYHNKINVTILFDTDSQLVVMTIMMEK